MILETTGVRFPNGAHFVDISGVLKII